MIAAQTTADWLGHLQPMACLSPSRLARLASHCRRDVHPTPRGRIPILDWRGQAVYLLRGELKLDLLDGSSCVLVGGTEDTCQPLGTATAPPREAHSITEIEVLRLDEDILDVTLTLDQLAQPEVACESGLCGASDAAAEMIGATALASGVFATMPPAHLASLLRRFERIEVARGEVVVHQDLPGDYYYVIERGRCEVERSVAGASVHLAELQPGDAFGEEALVSELPRNATVTMKTDGVLLRLSKDDFTSLLRAPLLHLVDVDEARRRVEGGAQWLDVRFPPEFRYDGLPGAINLPLNELRGFLPSLDVGREYVVYCASGRRSAAAAFLLSQRGVQASVLSGGLRALRSAEGEPQ